jgi:hypothetical protein
MTRISRCASHNRPRQTTGPTLTATMRASVAPEGVPKPGLSRPRQAPEQPQRADERRDRTGEEDPILASRTLSAGKKPAPQTSSANPRPHPDARETPSAHAASEFHVSAGNRSRRSRSPEVVSSRGLRSQVRHGRQAPPPPTLASRVPAVMRPCPVRVRPQALVPSCLGA